MLILLSKSIEQAVPLALRRVCLFVVVVRAKVRARRGRDCQSTRQFGNILTKQGNRKLVLIVLSESVEQAVQTIT